MIVRPLQTPPNVRPVTRSNGGRGGALVQIGAAFGRGRGQADHRHHGHVAVEDDADVGRAADGDALHRRVHDDPLFDDRGVDLAAERIEAGEDRRNVVVELALADDAAAGRFVIVTVAAGDDDDSAAGGSRSGLYDELARGCRSARRSG